MKFEYLFPEVYKKIGWVMFVVFSVLYVLSFAGVLSSLFPCKVFSLLPFTFLSENSFIQQNDGWEDEICMVGLVLSLHIDKNTLKAVGQTIIQVLFTEE